MMPVKSVEQLKRREESLEHTEFFLKQRLKSDIIFVAKSVGVLIGSVTGVYLVYKLFTSEWFKNMIKPKSFFEKVKDQIKGKVGHYAG